MVELEHAGTLLGQMGLDTAAQLLDAQLERSLHDQHTYVQFLNELLSSEQQERQRKSRETRLKLDRLPHRKGLEDFDFAFQPSIDKRQVEELAALAFVARDECDPAWAARRGKDPSGCWTGTQGTGSRHGGLLYHSLAPDCRLEEGTIPGTFGPPVAGLSAAGGSGY